VALLGVAVHQRQEVIQVEGLPDKAHHPGAAGRLLHLGACGNEQHRHRVPVVALLELLEKGEAAHQVAS
jgi:hypothetical protein